MKSQVVKARSRAKVPQRGEGTSVPANTEYNPLFEKLVIEPTDGPTVGALAYVFYKKAKWEWAQEVASKNGRPPNDEERKAYIATWTPTQIESARNQAAQVLTEFADVVINEARPDIISEELKGTFWKNVWASVFSAALYTIILIALVFIASVAGVDVLGIAERIVSHAPPPAG